MDLTEAEDIKRWQEELYKKYLHNQDNHDGMITHLEPDILECEDKWALLLSPVTPTVTTVSALAPSLHFFWSYFSIDLQ